MVDAVDGATRSRIMSRIRNRDTKPELLIRRELFKRGYRYRLNDRKLKGSPDLVFRKHKAVVFVHGCFWHRHDCRHFSWPKSRAEFWKNKLEANHRRDIDALYILNDAGWRTLVVWECAVRGKSTKDISMVAEMAAHFIESDMIHSEIDEISVGQANVPISGRDRKS